MSRRIGGGVWQTFFGPGSMVAPASPASSPRQPSHGRPLRLSMVAAARTRRTQTQDVVCPRPCQWERTDTRPDFGTINPPRAARTPGGRPDGRAVDPSPPAFTGTGPAAGSIGRARADGRTRYPSRYNSRYGADVGTAARGDGCDRLGLLGLLDLRGVHAAASDARHQDTDGATSAGPTDAHARAALLDLRCSTFRPFRRVRRIKQCSYMETYAKTRFHICKCSRIFCDLGKK